jgi:FlaA1/EpsC-like NDP-sugar epimerase
MTIPEAVSLVIAAGAQGTSGEVMILKMGSQVRIRDIAERLMEIAGKQTQIEVVGMRPGEKIHEVLTSPDDEMEPASDDAQGTIRAWVTPIDPSELDYKIWLGWAMGGAAGIDITEAAETTTVPTGVEAE